MATSDAPLSVPNVTLAVARGVQSPSFIDIDYTLDQVQAIFAAMNTVAAPADAIWASALAPDQPDGVELTQDGTEGNPYSVRRAIYSATPGKHVLLKDDGVYTQSKVIQTSSQYDETTYGDDIGHTVDDPEIVPWNMVEPTSAAERIVIRGEPGTCPVFDFTSTNIIIGSDFLDISYLRINNAASAIAVGTYGNLGSLCQGAHLHHIAGEFNRQIGGASTIGFFALDNSSAEGGTRPVIEYCFIKGNSSSENRNNTCVYIDKANKFAIRNNYFYGVQEHVIYFKAENDYVAAGGLGTVEIDFENNYCDGNVSWAGSGGSINNNIVTGSVAVINNGGGAQISQDHNTLSKNTVLAGINLTKLDWDSENNTVQNNITNFIGIQTGGGTATNLDPATNTNASDYNLINAADDGQRFLWGSQYADPPQYKTLPDWRTYIILDLNSAVQADQLKGLGTYTKLADFELVNGSAGLTLSDIGGAVGADISLVGIQ